MSDGRTFANLRQALVVASAAFAAECGIAFFWQVGYLAPWVALVAHAVLGGGLAAWSCRSAKARTDIRLPLLLVVSTGALGPIGAAGTLLTMALARWCLRRARPFEEWYRSIFPDTEEAEAVKLVNRIQGAEPCEAEPVTAFLDVLAFGSLRQKQDLIALISRDFRPVFGPVLKQALHDRESVIRVQAATAMSRLENSIMERSLALNQRIREKQGDLEALRALAWHYDTCLFCGILDPKRQEELLTAAIGVYDKCLTAEPGNSETRLAAGRLLLRAKQFRKASECFERLPDSRFTKSRAALWYLESLFQLGRFGEIRGLARAWEPSDEPSAGYPAEALDTLRLWAVSAPASGVRDDL